MQGSKLLVLGTLFSLSSMVTAVISPYASHAQLLLAFLSAGMSSLGLGMVTFAVRSSRYSLKSLIHQRRKQRRQSEY